MAMLSKAFRKAYRLGYYYRLGGSAIIVFDLVHDAVASLLLNFPICIWDVLR